MYLWVLENVLRNYSGGLVCVYAPTEEEAWKLLFKKDSMAWQHLRLWPDEVKADTKEKAPIKFRCVKNPEAFVVWGKK